MRLIVTNFNPRFTGVSATIQTLAPLQARQFETYLCGHPLDGCPQPVSFAKAIRLSRHDGGVIWHVRRNNEMLAALFVRDVLRLPVRIVFTSAAIRRHSAFPRWLISRMDAVVAASAEAAQFVDNVAAVAPHGVDTDRFHPAQDRPAAWEASGFGGRRGVAAVGRIRPEKGTDVFVDAMITCLPSLPDTVALVIGRAASAHGAFLEGLKQKVAVAGLSERILFPGEVAADRMPGLVRGLSLLAALPRYEGYGVTPLEAMASAVPFVASDEGYFRVFSSGGTAGVIVPTGDAAAAAEAIAALLCSPARLEAMSSAARETAVAKFSAQAEAAVVNAVYAQLLMPS